MFRDASTPHLDPLDWMSAAAIAPDLKAAGAWFIAKLETPGAYSVGIVFEMPNSLGTSPNEDEMFGHFLVPGWRAFHDESPHLIQHDAKAQYAFSSPVRPFVDVNDRATVSAWKLSKAHMPAKI